MGIVGSIKKGLGVAASSLPVVLVLFVFGFLFNMINLKLAPAGVNPNTPPTPSMIIAGVVFILATVFMQAGSMGYARDKIKQGSAALSNFTSAASKYYFKILLLSVIIALIIGAFVLLAALIVALLGQNASLVAMIIAIVIAAIGIYALILLFFAPYIAINEDKSAIAALKESVRVVRANILKVLGISLILILIGFLIGLLIGLIVGLVSRALPQGLATQILFAFLSSLVNAFLGFFVTASFMSFYLGLSSSPEASKV